MRAFIAFLLLTVAGCASYRGVEPKSSLADPAKLEAGRSLEGQETTAWPELDWWKRFGDPQLNALVDEGLTGSPNIRIARARVDQALGAAQVARAPLGPQVSADGSINRQRFSENYIFPPPIGGSTYTTTQLALNARYDLDFWGKNRSAYEAALGRSRAAQAEAFATRLALSAAIAGTYVQLARSYEQLDIAERTLNDRQQVQSLTSGRVKAGLDSKLELKQVETSIPAARARIAQTQEEIALARNQLAALLGKGPDRGLALQRPALRVVAVAVPSQVPAELLGRRPDIVASRIRAEAAAQDIKSAKAAFYPDINLAALVGVQSVNLSKLLQAGSAIPSATAAISLPILDGGRLRGALAQRDAEYDVAVEQYNQALSDALRDVVDQLTSMRSVQAQRVEADAAVASAEEAYQIALTRYKAGLGSLLSLIVVEQQVLDQLQLRADVHSRELALSINLIRALGGGFDVKVAMQ
ncbi:MAG TPA: efflux transporter outer membrane subunit, partial [Burkholderiales bacterium]|nr:efflux transporter outer membrane subunit [Burkholderiales bacterium]HXJ08310.1 efflux transporter outer membrane subunit [Burkholderiales bacterium]